MAADELYEKILIVKDLTDYQSGAVMSRTLLNKEKAAVTVYAFDTDQGLTECSSPYDTVLHVIEGMADIIIEGKQCTINDGNIVIIPANKLHAVKAKSACKMIIMLVWAKEK